MQVLQMPEHPLPPLTDGEYHVMLAAISETGRGRNFLAEYARRASAADTNHLFAAQNSMDVSGDAAAPEQAHDPWTAVRSMSEEEWLRMFS